MKLKKLLLVLSSVVLCMAMLCVFAACSSEAPKATEATTTTAKKTDNGDTTTQETPTPTTAAVTTAAVTTDNLVEGDKVVFDTSSDEISLYQNPITSKVMSKLWASYGAGDPFIMRYDGKYYLYVSTKDGYYGVRCFVSEDLVNWTYEGYCVEESEREILTAYAPEVTYYNGKFYMVTSPAGHGHYTLVSDSPTGPFEVVTGNYGHSIDGHIFIDNDGKWYFYHAGNAIYVSEMTSPTQVSGTSTSVGTTISDGANDWTEGPMVIYHDGMYYLTYTGNHVWNSSYRIYAATSAKSVKKFTPSSDNPFLVSNTSAVKGIGHSSTVKGPDLDSYYLVYHSHGPTMPQRITNIDRIVFNGKSMTVLGPTTENTAACPMPDIYSFFDKAEDAGLFDGSFAIKDGALVLAGGEKALSKSAIDGSKHTVELTVLNIKSGKAGVIFGYTDDNNYGSALFDKSAQQLVITFVVNGQKTEERVDLVKSFNEDYNFSALQAIQVEKNGSTYTFYVNDRELCKKTSSLGSGKVGMYAEGGEASFGYIGAVDEVGGSSNKEFYKPVTPQTGYIQANFCTEENIVTDKTLQGEVYVIASAGNSFNYRIYAEKDGNYDLSMYYKATSDSVVSVYVDGVLVKTVSLATTTSKNNVTEVMRGIPLTAGKHVITVYVESGSLEISEYNMLYSAEVEEIKIGYESTKEDTFTYRDGTCWSVDGGKLNVSAAVGKRLYGDFTWGDYTMEFDAKPKGSKINFGVLLHVQNPGESTLVQGNMTTSTTADGAREGARWMEGYFVEFTATTITIYKSNFVKQAAKYEAECRLKKDTEYHVKIVCEGANIKIFVDDELKLDWTDPTPYTNGMAGFKANNATFEIDNLVIRKNSEE